MALTDFAGAETQQAAAEEVTLTGTASLNTNASFIRTGSGSYRCNPASGAQGFIQPFPGNSGGGSIHFGLYIATLPSLTRVISGDATTGNKLRLTSTGTLEYFDGTSVIGTSAALSTATWYWIGWVAQGLVTGTLLAIGGAASVTGTSGGSSGVTNVGFHGTEASAADVYFDDLIRDGSVLLQPSKCVLLLPISDNANTAWTAGAGATTSLFDAVNNAPPVGVASANETDTTNIESASSSGTANYVANLTTYAAAGIVAADTILAIRLRMQTGEDISTGTKTGSFESTANPVIAATTISEFGVGAHGITPTTWTNARSAFAASPSVTLGSSLTMKVTKTDTTTRVACVDFMGAYVAYTPAAAGRVPYRSPYPQLLAH